MGRRKATECYLIQAWKSTDYHRCKFPNSLYVFIPHPYDFFSFQIVCKYFIEAVETQK
jgi:hypothetical protein